MSPKKLHVSLSSTEADLLATLASELCIPSASALRWVLNRYAPIAISTLSTLTAPEGTKQYQTVPNSTSGTPSATSDHKVPKSTSKEPKGAVNQFGIDMDCFG